MLEHLDLFLTAAGSGAIGSAVGIVMATRWHRRRNGATAQCAACNWESGRLPLADAFNAAAAHTATPAHTATERHRGFVVKA